MGMSEHDDKGKCEPEVRLWLEKRGIPYEHYVNLPTFHKIVLHNCVCTPTQPTSYSQRRDLYRRLCSLGSIAGRYSIDPVDSMTDEQLRTFLSPLTPSQGILWDDWGC